MSCISKRFFAVVLLTSLWPVASGIAAEPTVVVASVPKYTAGFSTVLRLGMDIQRMMDKKHRPLFPPNPVFMDLDLAPAARPAVVDSGTDQVRGVMISAGFIDLANNVAHARAIDMTEPGFFESYLAQLSRETGEKELAVLPNFANEAYWTEQVRNEQLSAFNQIVGMVVSINLAHIYLGQYEKYADKLRDADGRPVPLARLMSNGEWLKAMRTSTKNSLEAGLGMTGYIALCEAIDHMPTRPAWTEFFMPRDMRSSKLKSELEIMEAKFFSGRSI